jgi:hypothetical protein
LNVRKVKRKPSAIERISKVIFGLTSSVSDSLSSETRTEKTEKDKKIRIVILSTIKSLKYVADEPYFLRVSERKILVFSKFGAN